MDYSSGWDCKCFIVGLDAYACSRLDGATRGALMNRTYEDVYDLIENMVMDSFQWPNERFTYSQQPSTAKDV